MKDLSWPIILQSPLSRGEVFVLLFLVLNLPDDFDSGQSELAHILNVERTTLNQTLRQLCEKDAIEKTKMKDSLIKRISLHRNLKQKLAEHHGRWWKEKK